MLKGTRKRSNACSFFMGLELCFIPYSSSANVMEEMQTPLFSSFFSRCNTCSGLFFIA